MTLQEEAPLNDRREYYAELKRLAEGAAGLPETDLGDSLIEARRDWQAVCDAFRKAASASVVLELLTEIEALESELEATKINEGIWFDIAHERRTNATLLSEIEGLKARIKCLEKLGGEQSLRVMEQATRAKDAENALADLRTQAPDSWRPTEQEVENVLRCCDAMERSVERKGLPKSEADICVATDWLRKVCAVLRPQTAESGK